jgi:hypothetical protein
MMHRYEQTKLRSVTHLESEYQTEDNTVVNGLTIAIANGRYSGQNHDVG